MCRGFAEILSGELQGSAQRYVLQWRALHSFDASLGKRPDAPGISAESTAALVAGANEIVYGDFFVADGALHATATEEDLATHKVALVASASGPASSGIFPVAAALARQFGETHPFGTRDQQALRDYVAQDFAKATADDPNFGQAYVSWLDTALDQRNRAAADGIVAQARAHQDRFSALSRTQLNLDAAALSGDFQAQLEARRELARLDPADPNGHRGLAEALMSVRDYDAAIVEFRRALSIRPDDATALNLMGYAAAYSGDLPTAIRVLRGYEQLRPNEPNPLDSLGDAHFALGHFPEAEKFYLAAYDKAPGFLKGGDALKAAQARLMTGDVQGATTVFNRYMTRRQAARDPNVPYHAAEWSWQIGQRRRALAGMDRLALATSRADAPPALREIACRADAQEALWMLNLGDRAGAVEHARKAIAEANPAMAPLAGLVAYLAQPDAFPAPVQSPLKEYAQAYGLLFGKQFPAAAKALQELYRRPTNELDDGLAVLLAWAYEATGQWQSAEPLLRLTPLAQASGVPLFASLYFPRLFFLRGVVLDREGHPAEAARYYQLFRTLSGPDSAMWGEEQRAR
jgi:tetratricopeptide (TPR) repeat protein